VEVVLLEVHTRSATDLKLGRELAIIRFKGLVTGGAVSSEVEPICVVIE
jgi:hypothetical protein